MARTRLRFRGQRTPHRALLVSLAAFVVLGMADSGLGVAWPSIRALLGRSLSELGPLLAALSLGYLVASTSSGRLAERWSLGNLLVVGASLLALAVLGLAVVAHWWVALGVVAMMGLGAGLLDVGVNANAALEFDRGSINNLHAAYGVGATLGPLMLTASLETGLAWRGGYGALFAIQLWVAYMIWRRRVTWTGGEQTDDPPSGLVASRARIAALLLVFLVYTGVEVATGQWAFSLLTLGRGMTDAAAGLWVALYWGGLTIGRLASGVVGDRVTSSLTLNLSIALSAVGLAVLWWDPSGLGVLGLPLAGVGFAAVFPTMVALTPDRIGRRGSTRMIGYQLAAANVGAATVPWALGLVADLGGIGALPGGLVVTTLVLAGLHLWLDRAERIPSDF